MPNDLKSRKIMPLNQTARADVLVRGNPVTTRPDATVENTFPGLEFDHRNLEKRFLDGLLLELHAASGGWLRDYDRTRGFPFSQADFDAGLKVWAVVGNIPQLDEPGTPRMTIRWAIGTMANQGAGGSSIWQFIREFEPGPAAVVLGPDRPQLTLDQQSRIIQTLTAGQTAAIPVPGAAPIVVIWGQRADYLKNGVIDPERYEPGDLTRSLCSPWQYDFTDCGCWYWASNKPDMVSVTPDGPQIYNFQRVRTGEIAPEPPTHPPVVAQGLWSTGDPAGATMTPSAERVPRRMNHAELITGWEKLPVVIDDTETDRFVDRPAETLPESELFPDRATIVDRLMYLAGIEHALMVEYLYAFYSINAPRQRPLPTDTEPLRLFEAANTILSVAIDEMRHFRWVNEILVLLGGMPVVSRATETKDTNGNGRYLPHTFALTAATQAQIDWFILVEQNSRAVDPDVQSDTVDGMYTRLYLSIEKSTEISQAIKDRVLHLTKLIIDEGYDHFHRFQRVRQLLPSPPDVRYLRLASNPMPLQPADTGKGFELRVDRSYEVILNLLMIVFGRGDAEHGQLLEATRIAMVDSLDVEIENLITAGGAPLFTPPSMSTEVNLGRFTAKPSVVMGGGLHVERTALDEMLDIDTVIANATRPLDELNTVDVTSADIQLQARASRSVEAMTRVRAAFAKAIRAAEQ
ncbi:hypothetical protein IYY11_02560 [Methylocystis sp. H62]|uniref:ferritin-like domain-containing protein n=1 Tax=Methylocystis sp. H62 TaxID=2785789 RepID=UPI0018C2664D|nr:ferritin-like domain-containing protein [Methylocystis sp. H62]MBG0792340.1 hypothetical protein [Methylocystis sp. H62]